MQRTLSTLGLILSTLVVGCDDTSPTYGPTYDAGAYANESFCSLPDPTSCFIADGADAGQPTNVQDAASFYDAGGGGSDASIAVQDAGTPQDGSSTLTNPCAPVDCVGPEPERVMCGGGVLADVICRPGLYGDCEWYFVCGSP